MVRAKVPDKVWPIFTHWIVTVENSVKTVTHTEGLQPLSPRLAVWHWQGLTLNMDTWIPLFWHTWRQWLPRLVNMCWSGAWAVVKAVDIDNIATEQFGLEHCFSVNYWKTKKMTWKASLKKFSTIILQDYLLVLVWKFGSSLSSVLTLSLVQNLNSFCYPTSLVHQDLGIKPKPHREFDDIQDFSWFSLMQRNQAPLNLW